MNFLNETNDTIIEIHIQKQTSHSFASINDQGEYCFLSHVGVSCLEKFSNKSLVLILDQQFDYQKSLDLSNKEDSSLMSIYYQITNIYNKLKDYHQAISFFEETLKIQLKILTNHPKAIGATYMNLSTVYLKLKQFNRAFHSASQAYQLLLAILPKNHQEIIQIRALLDSIKIAQILQDKS